MLSKAKHLNEEDFKNLLLKLQEEYEHGEEKISDDEFDVLVSYYEGKFDVKFTDIGARHKGKGQDVVLPYSMMSLNKAKGENAEKALKSFKQENPDGYVIAEKLDGNAGEYIVRHLKGGKVVQHLYTRGDGTIGKDISSIIPCLDLPIPDEDIVIRGEIIFPQKAFKKYVEAEKEKGNKRKLNNARSVANGIMLAGDSFNKKACSKLMFVPFNILSDNDLTQEEQYIKLEELGFLAPWFITTDNINVKKLTRLLEERRKEAPFDIDGLVITNNSDHIDFSENKNPEHQIAFKIDKLVKTTVTKVTYRASKDGKLKPRIWFKKVFVSGADVEKAYAHNAKFIIDEFVGPSAEVLVTRGGDSIPHVVEILTPAKRPQLPDYDKDEYIWTDSGVDLILLDPTNDPDVKISILKHFVKHMGIDNLGEGRLTNLFDIGIEDISSLINADIDLISSAEKLGQKSAKTIYNNIHAKITNAPLANVMAASGVFGFGFGITRAKSIVDRYPDILDYSKADEGVVAEMLIELGGFNKLAISFEENLPRFKRWLRKHPLITIAAHKPKVIRSGKSLPLSGQLIVFTGFTDTDLNTQVEELGGTVIPNYRVAVTIVVAKDTSKVTSKIQKAAEKGAQIISLKDFVKKYGLVTTKL